MSLNSKEMKILKEIVEAGYKMLLHKYSEEELNKVVKEIYKKVK